MAKKKAESKSWGGFKPITVAAHPTTAPVVREVEFKSPQTTAVVSEPARPATEKKES